MTFEEAAGLEESGELEAGEWVRVLTNEDSLDAGELLPGFSRRVSGLLE